MPATADNPPFAAASSALARTARVDPAPAIAFCALFVLVLFLPTILTDTDTLWQIRTGEWILDHRAIPAIDPFSYTAGGKPWFAHEWLAETLMAVVWRAAGMAGIMILAAAAMGLTGAIVLRHARRFLPGIYAVLALIVALSNAAPSLLARPHLLAWPCLALWCAGLANARAQRVTPSFWLLPVMLIWVNLHGSFIIGLIMGFALMLEAVCDNPANARRVLSDWTGFLLAAFAVTLLNPDGLSGALFPIQMIGMKSLVWIGEWQPTDFGRIQPLELMILAGLALGLSGAVRLPPMRWLILLGLVHGALAHARNGQLLGLIGILILAEPLGASLGRGGASLGLGRGGASLGRGGASLGPGRGGATRLPPVWRPVATAAAMIALAAMAARLALPLDPGLTGEAFATLVNRVPPAVRATPVLNDYSLGGNLIFAGQRPFIDSRADLYGDAFLTAYRDIAAAGQMPVIATLTRHDIGWTIFPAGHPIVAILDHMPRWHRLLEAEGMIIHARDAPPAR